MCREGIWEAPNPGGFFITHLVINIEVILQAVDGNMYILVMGYPNSERCFQGEYFIQGTDV